MNDMTFTALRKRLFREADRVPAIGAPIRFRRGARVLTRLKPRNLIAGDASTLWKVKAGSRRGRASAG
jgi:hypothetical protein